MPWRRRAARICGAALLAVPALVGCGESGSDTADATTPVPTPLPTVPVNTPGPRETASPPIPARTFTPTPATPKKVRLGNDFRLREGQSAAVEGTDLVLTYTRLVSDSRCPTNVTCIQAGEATIAITVVAVGGARSFELSTPGNAGANEQRFGKFLIQLQAVEPYPTDPASGQVDVAKVAVLRVTRA